MSKIKSNIVMNHTKNNYKKLLKDMNYQEIFSEYNKLNLLLQIMNKNKTANLNKKNQENIKVIKYKYNLLCQEITKRQYHIMNENYKPKNATIRYSR